MIKIGGDKGHIEEIIHEPVFIALYTTFRWKPIRNCTGRFTCLDHKIVSSMTPLTLLHSSLPENTTDGNNTNISSFQQYYLSFEDKSKDPIIVIPFTDEHTTGLITYVKEKENKCRTSDSEEHTVNYVHTLNSPSGFQRKLAAIHVHLCRKFEIPQSDCNILKHDVEC